MIMLWLWKESNLMDQSLKFDIPSAMSFSRISQANMVGFSRLYDSILPTTSGVATLGLEPPIIPGGLPWDPGDVESRADGGIMVGPWAEGWGGKGGPPPFIRLAFKYRCCSSISCRCWTDKAERVESCEARSGWVGFGPKPIPEPPEYMSRRWAAKFEDVDEAGRGMGAATIGGILLIVFTFKQLLWMLSDRPRSKQSVGELADCPKVTCKLNWLPPYTRAPPYLPIMDSPLWVYLCDLLQSTFTADQTQATCVSLSCLRTPRSIRQHHRPFHFSSYFVRHSERNEQSTKKESFCSASRLSWLPFWHLFFTTTTTRVLSIPSHSRSLNIRRPRYLDLVMDGAWAEPQGWIVGRPDQQAWTNERKKERRVWACSEDRDLQQLKELPNVTLYLEAVYSGVSEALIHDGSQQHHHVRHFLKPPKRAGKTNDRDWSRKDPFKGTSTPNIDLVVLRRNLLTGSAKEQKGDGGWIEEGVWISFCASDDDENTLRSSLTVNWNTLFCSATYCFEKLVEFHFPFFFKLPIRSIKTEMSLKIPKIPLK